jgi:hypothetical protein
MDNILKTDENPGVAALTKPRWPPHFVSKHLGVSGARLPRIASNTIGTPAEPSKKRGGPGSYSYLDIMMIRLGSTLLDLGLLPRRTVACTSEVRRWLLSVAQDPELRRSDFDSLIEKKRFLLGQETADSGFQVRLVDIPQLSDFLTSKDSARPHILINVTEFLVQSWVSLKEDAERAIDPVAP